MYFYYLSYNKIIQKEKEKKDNWGTLVTKEKLCTK